MISLIQALPAGSAISITVSYPGGGWAVLRREDSQFGQYPDETSVLVEAGGIDRATPFVTVLDCSQLVNGVTYWYQVFFNHGAGWFASGEPASCVPAYHDQPGFQVQEPVEIVRDRLESAIAAEVALGNLSNPSGTIRVLRSPPIVDNVVFPCITVLLESQASEVRSIGESILSDAFNAEESVFEEYQGWLDRSVIQITAWSLNADERSALRRAIRKILILNLPVFSEHGMTLVDVSSADNFDAQSYGAPVFQAVFNFSCQHPAVVANKLPLINHVESEFNG